MNPNMDAQAIAANLFFRTAIERDMAQMQLQQVQAAMAELQAKYDALVQPKTEPNPAKLNGNGSDYYGEALAS